MTVQADAQGRPTGAAWLSLRRRGPVTEVRLLGDGIAAVPPGSAPHRLLAADAAVAAELATGIQQLLWGIRGPWRLALAGLPLGDPVLAALGSALGTGASFATARSRRLVDSLDEMGPVRRSQDAGELERWLPVLLDRRPTGTRREVLRSLARVHAAAGVLEHAVLLDRGQVRAGLLTLVDGAARRPWWGFSEVGGLEQGPGQPLVSLGASSGVLTRRTLSR